MYISDNVTWILGDSFIFWGAFQYAEDVISFPLALKNLRESNGVFYSVHGLKMDKLPGLLEAKLNDSVQKPNRIIVYVGTNDIHLSMSVNQLLEKVSKMTATLF